MDPNTAITVAVDQLRSNRVALAEAQAELAQWRQGELRFQPEIIDADESSVSAGVVRAKEPPPALSRKRPLEEVAAAEGASSSMARIVRVKQEKLDAEEDRDEFEGNLQSQALFTDFLQGKIDELKALALRAGADEAAVTDVCNRVYRRG